MALTARAPGRSATFRKLLLAGARGALATRCRSLKQATRLVERTIRLLTNANFLAL